MKKASEILDVFFRNHRITEGDSYTRLLTQWQEIAGTDIGAHSFITDVKNGSLILAVDHPGWMQKINLHKSSIVREINKRYPQLSIRNLLMVYRDPSEWRRVDVDADLKRLLGDMKTQRERKRKEIEQEAPGTAIVPPNRKDIEERIAQIEDTAVRTVFERFLKYGGD